MSETITREDLRIGTGELFACHSCGIPKREMEFEGGSILCKVCAPRVMNAKNIEVTEEDVRKTKYDIALDRLRDSQEPAVPGGVQKAHTILGGSTSSELLAEVIRDMRDGQKPNGDASWIPRDPKMYNRSLELLQRAEFKHDEALKKADPASALTYEEIRSLSIDTIVQEMIRDRELRIKILGILYERCPNLIDELMQVSDVTVISHDELKPASKTLDLGAVI